MARAMERTDNHTGAIVFGLAIASFAAYQQFKLPVVLPILLERYGYDRALAGGFMSIYALVGLIVSIQVGRLVERLGPLFPLLAATGLFVAGSLVTLLWPESGLVVLFGRALEGLGFAVVAIVGPVMANAHATPRHLPIVAGLTAAWIRVGQLAATVAAPWALGGPGWQGLWWIAILGSLGFGFWMVVLRYRDAAVFARPAPKPAAASTGDSVALSLRQKTALYSAAAIFMLWSCQYFAYMTWLPQYLVEARRLGVSGALAGYVISVTLVLLSCVAAGILLRFHIRLPVLMIAALVIQAAIWWALPLLQSTGAGILALAVYGASAGLVPGCLFATPSAVMRSGSRTAKAFGIIMTGRNIGVLSGPVLLAWAYEWSRGWDFASPLFGAITTLCLPLAFAFARALAHPAAVRGSNRPPGG